MPTRGLTDDEVAEQGIPLNRFPSQRTDGASLAIESPSSSSPAASTMPLPREMVIQGIVSFLLFNVGLYGPKYLVLPFCIDDILQRPTPYQETQAGDVILDSLHTQALVDPPTIPSHILMWSSVWLPLILVGTTAWFWKNQDSTTTTNNTATTSVTPTKWAQWHNLHAALCGLAMAIGLSDGTTQLLKLYMLRRRPNFYALCQFNTIQKVCTADPHRILEAQLSFPSGHSSLSCCGMTFVVWFFLGKIVGCSQWNTNTKRFWGLLACCVPWGWAIFVAASRVHDQWHHPSDIITGLVLGGLVATIVYHVWFPPAILGPSFAGVPWSLASGPQSAGGTGIHKLPSFHE